MDSSRPRNLVERLSTPALMRLHALPRWAFPSFTAVLLIGGLISTNPLLSILCLGLLMVFLGWLIALSWSLLTWSARLMRIAVIGMLVFLLIDRLTV